MWGAGGGERDVKRGGEVKVKNGGEENRGERRQAASDPEGGRISSVLPASIALSLRTRRVEFNKANPPRR